MEVEEDKRKRSVAYYICPQCKFLLYNKITDMKLYRAKQKAYPFKRRFGRVTLYCHCRIVVSVYRY